jgi:rubrerythrin
MATAEQMRQYREDNPDHAARNRGKIAARKRALAELANRHRREFEDLLRVEHTKIAHETRCPVCDTPVSLTPKNLIRKHRLNSASEACPGSGQLLVGVE